MCGWPWGCVCFKRADDCDAAFRKLESRAQNGEDVVRVLFAPPDYVTPHARESSKSCTATAPFGITGPGYAPGFEPDEKQPQSTIPGLTTYLDIS